MLIAAVYDIHGNAPALSTVLEEISSLNVDRIVVGGDVMLGPMPIETMSLLDECPIPQHFIMGNTDREVLARSKGETTEWFRRSPKARQAIIDWTSQQLNDELQGIIGGWPKTFGLTHDWCGQLLFCHATPRNDVDIFTRLTPDEKLLPLFADFAGQTVVCGHTHMQFDRNIGDTRVVNAGSVGMPFGDPGAYWLLLGDEIELRKTEYDLDAACQEIAATSFPDAKEFAKHQIRIPPAEQKMLNVFANAELPS